MKLITNEFHLHGADDFCVFIELIIQRKIAFAKGQQTAIDGPIIVKIEQEGEFVQWNDHYMSPTDFLYRKQPNLTISGTSRHPVPTLKPGVICADVLFSEPKCTAQFVTSGLVCVRCEKIKDSDRYSFLLTDDFHEILMCWTMTQPPPEPMKIADVGKLYTPFFPKWLWDFQEATVRRTKLFEIFQTSHANSPEAADVPLLVKAGR